MFLVLVGLGSIWLLFACCCFVFPVLPLAQTLNSRLPSVFNIKSLRHRESQREIWSAGERSKTWTGERFKIPVEYATFSVWCPHYTVGSCPYWIVDFAGCILTLCSAVSIGIFWAMANKSASYQSVALSEIYSDNLDPLKKERDISGRSGQR